MSRCFPRLDDIHFTIRKTGSNPDYPWQVRFNHHGLPYRTSVKTWADAIWIVSTYYKQGFILAYPETH